MKFLRGQQLIAHNVPHPYTLPRFISAAAVFEGEVRTAIISLKYRNRRRLARPLAGILSAAVMHKHGGDVPFDCVTWAPTTGGRRRQRGLDQSELIARHVASSLRIPARSLLKRMSHKTQTHRTRHERLAGPIFRAHDAAAGQRILIVDDVTTTGATLHAARRAFRLLGVELVECWAVAATPSR